MVTFPIELLQPLYVTCDIAAGSMLDEDDYNPSDGSQSAVAEEEEEELVVSHAASSSDS